MNEGIGLMLNSSVNARYYGAEPYQAIVVHGGPGALGTVPAIARELSKDYGVIEPEKCGHNPWKERYAKDLFYEILREEMR